MLLLTVAEVVACVVQSLVAGRQFGYEFIGVGVPQPNVGFRADHERHLVEPLSILLGLRLLLVYVVDAVLDLQVSAHRGVRGRRVPRLHPLQRLQRMDILERPLSILRLIPKDVEALVVLNHELKLGQVAWRVALAFRAGRADDLRGWAAAFPYVARIGRQSVWHLDDFIRLQIDQRIERVLLVEPFDLAWVAEALLSLLLEVLAWLDRESRPVLVGPGSDMALPSVLRP